MGKLELILLLLMYAGYHLKTSIVTNEVLDEYDFIIVGAGTTGAAVAGRLSEDPNVKILLLEAGVSDLSIPQLRVPYLTPVEMTSADWDYKSTPQKFALRELVGKVDRFPRGKLLGGTSCINHEIYHRGSPHDFDSWVDHGAKGWGWEKVEPFFRKAERASEPGLSQQLGTKGAIKLTKSYKIPLDNIFEDAVKEIGMNKSDYIDDLEGGLSDVTTTISDGLRINSIEAYLRGHFPQRKERLHVVIEALVTKILFRSGDDGSSVPRATAVKYLKDGKERIVSARKEIIISAGAFETPHLLMLSGIGPRDHLLENKIPVTVDLPGVGENLQDHVRLALTYYIGNLPEGAVITAAEINKGISEYLSAGGGPLRTNAGVTSGIHYKTKLAGTPASESTKKRPFPEIQLLTSGVQFSLREFQQNPYASTFKFQDYIPDTIDAVQNRNGVLTNFVIAAGLLHPKSRGNVELQSSDPEVYPIIDPNYLSDDDDVKVFIEGLRFVEEIENTPTFRKYGMKVVMQPYCNTTENNILPRSDEYYRCRIRTLAATEYHPCCTAKIGRKSDKYAVVDEKLRVFGVTGLRVADASVMPHHMSGNPQGTCYMIGEKAADMIKQEWNMRRFETKASSTSD